MSNSIRKIIFEYKMVRFKNNADKSIVRCFKHTMMEAQWTK